MTPRDREPKQKKVGLPAVSTFKSRKGKLSGGIVALSSAAIISIYTLGRASTGDASNDAFVDAPTAAASAVPSARAVRNVGAAPTLVPSTNRGQPSPTPSPPPASSVTYKDGTYVGTGKSRHGGMQVTAVIKGGKIVSANVTSCGTRYPCSDVNGLVKAAVNQQAVPASHVSGASDSSQAYKQALTAALSQAKA